MLAALARLPLLAPLPVLASCTGGGSVCADPEVLSTSERQLRASLHYTERSPHGDAKRCAGCQFFSAGSGDCGQCQILNGPVNPGGHCDSWSERT